jgi:hypothetical protein
MLAVDGGSGGLGMSWHPGHERSRRRHATSAVVLQFGPLLSLNTKMGSSPGVRQKTKLEIHQTFHCDVSIL